MGQTQLTDFGGRGRGHMPRDADHLQKLEKVSLPQSLQYERSLLTPCSWPKDPFPTSDLQSCKMLYLLQIPIFWSFMNSSRKLIQLLIYTSWKFSHTTNNTGDEQQPSPFLKMYFQFYCSPHPSLLYTTTIYSHLHDSWSFQVSLHVVTYTVSQREMEFQQVKYGQVNINALKEN